jgi:hypothetical protein
MTGCLIYGLVDPETKEIRYIGKTSNLKNRLYSHIWHAKHNGPWHLSKWAWAGLSLMSKNKARETCKSKDKSLASRGAPVSGWKQAILDARQQLAASEARALELRRAIQAFEDLRDAGEPWPGTSESDAGLIGQKGDMGQSRKHPKKKGVNLLKSLMD